MISNTKAAVAAFAEAVSDGVADELCRRLFHVIWVQGRHVSSAYEVRRVIAGVMWPPEDITDRLASPDFPSLLLRDPDIAPDRAPVGRHDRAGRRVADHERIRQWRQEWLALPSQVVSAAIGTDQAVRPGIEGLRYLVDLASTAGLPAHAETEPGRDAQPMAIARVA